MKVLVRGDSGRIRKLISLSCSGYLHGSILAWVAFGPAMGPAERRRSLYEQQIKPDEHRIIWYNLKERLPEVAPAEKSADVRPPRAVRPFEQPLLAEGESTRPPQLISIPAPEMALPKLLPLPNVVSAATPRRVAKLYAPPPEKPVEMATAPLPEAPKIEPKVDAKLPFEPPRPLRKKFNTPESRLARQADVTLPEAPRVETRIEQPQSALANSAPRAQPRAFRPPKETPQPASPTLALPEAPLIAGATDPKSLPSAVPPPRPLLRAFAAPPPSAPRREGPAALPAAPELLRNPAALPTTPLPAGPKPFLIAPKNSTAAAEPAPLLETAPSLGANGMTGDAGSAMAIVGLDPAKTIDFQTPPGSQKTGFSAGPQPRPDGGAGTKDSNIVVPGLTAQGKNKDAAPTLVASLSPTSRENLAAAAREAIRMRTPPATELGRALRTAPAPDPMLGGRVVYTVAIQMPNVTSYSGSWLVWFAEREPLPGAPPTDMRPPQPLHKVDPKYIAAAAAERVEGKVRLSAVIRKNGRVDSVALLQHLDDRLDRSAQEALAKWEFEPALRNGSAVDVDCVFEIPFRLAPRLAK